MFFNDDVLVLFPPKTAGTSLAHLLLRVLPPPCVAAPPGRETLPSGWTAAAAPHGHQTLSEAQEFLEDYDRRLADFREIIVVLRDPYEQAVSMYSHMQRETVESARVLASNPTDDSEQKEYQHCLAAIDSDFESYVESSFFAEFASRMSQYLMIDGQTIDNVRLFHLETLDTDFPELMKSVGSANHPVLTRLNASRHVEWQAYYSPNAVDTVNDRYSWAFDRGLYSRAAPTAFESFSRLSLKAHVSSYDLLGSVSQNGPIEGLYQDGWVGEALTIPVMARAPIENVVITGAVPTFVDGFTLDVEGPSGSSKTTLGLPGAFLLTAPFSLPGGSSGTLTVQPSPNWSRASKGAFDDRHLTFYLNDVAFLPRLSD